MRKGLMTSILLALVGAGFWAAAATRLVPLYEMRREYNLQSKNPLQDPNMASELRLPPVVLFTFRALAIDYLWIRADNLKDAGQYFDALHLAQIICTLQPNLDVVWDFQAWNMAYNISVALPTAPQRWHWVQAGFELLRNQGLRYNPHSLKIYRSLAWIFQHKIGGISDDYHRYYKLQLALEMTPLLKSLVTGEINSNEDLAALAGITSDWNKLKSDPQMTALIDKIKQAEPKFVDDEEIFKGLLEIRVKPTSYTPGLHQLLADNRNNPALKSLDAFIRARILRDQWHMDPARMLRLNRKYGPVDFQNEDQHLSLDWRLPFSHAIYWASSGLDTSKEKTGLGAMNLYRVVYQSLQDMYHYGKLEIITMTPLEPEPEQGREILDKPKQYRMALFNSEDLRMFPVAYDATQDFIQIYKDAGKEISGGTTDFLGNLCRSGIISMYLADHKRTAQKYLVHLRQLYPENKDHQVPLDSFVQRTMREEIKTTITPKNASDYILNLFRAMYRNYAMGNEEAAYVREQWAKQIHQELKLQHTDSDDPTERLTLPPLPQLRMRALMDFLSDQRVDPVLQDVLLARLRSNDPKLFEQIMAEWKKQNQPSGS